MVYTWVNVHLWEEEMMRACCRDGRVWRRCCCCCFCCCRGCPRSDVGSYRRLVGFHRTRALVCAGARVVWCVFMLFDDDRRRTTGRLEGATAPALVPARRAQQGVDCTVDRVSLGKSHANCFLQRRQSVCSGCFSIYGEPSPPPDLSACPKRRTTVL